MNERVYGDYLVGELIRCGSFSEVRHGRHAKTGSEVALKISKENNMELEFECWHALNHSNIVRVHEVLHIEENGNTVHVLVMELIRGKELFTILESGKLDEPQIKSLLRQLCSALSYIHTARIVHRDVKLENTLIIDYPGGRMDLKLADFGLATKINGCPLLTDYCGSTAYSSPEVQALKPYDGRKGDAWSVGVVLYAMLTGRLPFRSDLAETASAEEHEHSIKVKVLEGLYQPLDDSVSPEAHNLLEGLLNLSPDSRLSVQEALDHPFLNR